MSDIIDINVNPTVEEVTIDVQPNVTVVNVNTIQGIPEAPIDGEIYGRQDASWEIIPPVDVSALVPYTGATTDVDLGENGISTGFVKFDTTPTDIPELQGAMFWDEDDNTVDVILNGYRMKIGEDTFYPVKNQSGSTITKGTNVKFAGTVGASGRLLILPFLANGTDPSYVYMGVTAEDIADGEDGKVLWFGRLRGLNTNAFNEGDILYASTTSAGGFQTAIPTGANNIVQVSAVIKKSTTQGVIFIRPQIEPVLFKPENVANKSINLTSPDDVKYPTTLAVSTALSGKQDTLTNPITGTGANGQVSFWNGANSQSGDNGLFWDNTNKRLGVGTTTPSVALDLNASYNFNTGVGRILNIKANSGPIVIAGFGTGLNFGLKIGSGAVEDVAYIDVLNTQTFRSGDISFKVSQGSAPTEAMRISYLGNILLGTSTNAGFKLDVNGTARVQGITTITPATLTGATATSALDIAQTWNTTGTPTAIRLNVTDTASNANSLLMDLQVGGSSRFTVLKNGTINFRLGSSIRPSNGSNAIGTSASNGLNLISALSPATGGVSDFIFVNNQGNPNNTTGTRVLVDLQRGFAPTSGTGQYIDLRLLPTINQTGGANGITRGLFINPTLTSAADWRAIEVSNGGAYINTTSVQASAILQADSTTKGFLPPRMTNAERLAIASPAVGLIVYCTDVVEGLYVNKSTGWTFVI